MTYRYDPDDVIAAWAAESTGGGGPDYLPEVLLMVERTPQHRWARWVPGAGTRSPATAPAMNTRAILVVAAALLLLLIASALAAGALRRPAFTLQGTVPSRRPRSPIPRRVRRQALVDGRERGPLHRPGDRRDHPVRGPAQRH